MVAVVGVENGQIVAAGQFDPAVDSGMGALVFLADEPVRPPALGEDLLRQVGGGILRAVIDKDNLEIGIILSEHGVQRIGDVVLVVEGGDYGGDEGEIIYQ